MDAMTCATCRFWAVIAGECRRHAPIVIPLKVVRVWPETSGSHWCGDHEFAKETP